MRDRQRPSRPRGRGRPRGHDLIDGKVNRMQHGTAAVERDGPVVGTLVSGYFGIPSNCASPPR